MFPAIVALLLLRATVSGLIPLSAHEAYYWLWSKHLAAGYFDHPPAIAFLIRGGTLLFGDTAFGVRASGIVLSLLASWFVWRAARDILQDESRALTAALLFNLTLMTSAEMLAATPDLPSVTTSAAFIFCLARLQRSGNGRWWLAAGVAAGLGLLSKYSALFLGAGALVWLLADPRARRWLATPWLWAGGALALLIFLPNLLWQAGHSWMTFAFQFGRTMGGHLTARFLIEFIGAQFGLASPFILILAGVALAATRRKDDLFLLAALIMPALLYFLIHALHDRVQGNWPCFLYPALAILAASAFSQIGWRGWLSRAAMPVAVLMLALVYFQCLTGLLPFGKNDPLARLLGVGFKPVADSLVSAEQAAHAGAVVTSDYETTAWLRFYEPRLAVIQVGETYRYPTSPAPDTALLHRPLLYFVEEKRDQSVGLKRYFSSLSLATQLEVTRQGAGLSAYRVYLAQGAAQTLPGRMP